MEAEPDRALATAMNAVRSTPQVGQRPRWAGPGFHRPSWFSIASAAAVVVLAIGVGLAFASFRTPTDGDEVGAGAAPSNVNEACPVTRPDPAFAAPSPYPSSAPRAGSAWFGTPELWTMLDADGEVWPASGVPEVSVKEKTFWWSSAWNARSEQEPAITVTGKRLDGPGSFRSDHGTNATAPDLGGDAMLVGVEFPSPGCWQLTAEYRDAALSYVVWIKEE